MREYPAHMWLILSRRPQDVLWHPFGLPHPYEDATNRRDALKAKFPDQEWRVELEASWKQ